MQQPAFVPFQKTVIQSRSVVATVVEGDHLVMNLDHLDQCKDLDQHQVFDHVVKTLSDKNCKSFPNDYSAKEQTKKENKWYH